MLMDTLIFYYDVIITSFSDKKEKDLFRVNGYPFMVICFCDVTITSLSDNERKVSFEG